MKNENRSRKKLIKYIMHIRDVELSKPVQKMDVELISECVRFLLQLKGKTVILTEEEIKERVDRIPFSN